MGKGGGKGKGGKSAQFNVDINKLIDQLFGSSDESKNDLFVYVENGCSDTFVFVFHSCSEGHGDFVRSEGDFRVPPALENSEGVREGHIFEAGYEGAGAGCNTTIVLRFFDTDGTDEKLAYALMVATPSTKSNYYKGKKIKSSDYQKSGVKEDGGISAPYDWEALYDELDDNVEKIYANGGHTITTVGDYQLTIEMSGKAPARCKILVEDKPT